MEKLNGNAFRSLSIAARKAMRDVQAPSVGGSAPARRSSTFNQIVQESPSEARRKGPRLVSMLRAVHLEQPAPRRNHSASVVPCKEGELNMTFHDGAGLMFETKNGLRQFVLENSRFVSPHDLGDPDGPALQVQSIQGQDAREKEEMLERLLKALDEPWKGRHNEVVLGSEHLQAAGNKMLVKEHHDVHAEQLNVLVAGMAAQLHDLRHGGPGNLDALTIVLLPTVGPAVERPYRELAETFVAKTGIPMESIVAAVQESNRCIERDFFLAQVEPLREELSKARQASAALRAQPPLMPSP